MKWISIEDRLPPEDEFVLICDSSTKLVEMGICMDEKFFIPHLAYKLINATHWMPLPKIPKR